MKISNKLYKRVQVTLLTKLADGSLLWPDEIAYVEATPKQIAYAHPRCETCHHFDEFGDHCKRQANNKKHPQEYCSQHTSLLEPSDEIS